MKQTSMANWLGEMAFDIELDSHHLIIDADLKVGGENKGPRPKGLLLSSLAGCTGMDVVSILKKMKVEDYELKLNIEGELTEEHPKIYHTINLNYIFTGKDLPTEKLKRAVELSETRYCGVTEMLRKAATINTKIIVNGDEIK